MQHHADSDWNTLIMELLAHRLLQLKYSFSTHWVFLFYSPSVMPKKSWAHLWTHLPCIIEAVFVEDGVNLGILKSTEQQRLTVVLGPVVETLHSHSGEVYPMGFQRQQINVLHQVLHRDRKTHHCRLISLHPDCTSLNCSKKWAGMSKKAQNLTVVISQDTAVWSLLTISRVLKKFHSTELRNTIS